MQLRANDEPERLWQFREWQQFVKIGVALSVYSTLLQKQEPFKGRGAIFFRRRRVRRCRLCIDRLCVVGFLDLIKLKLGVDNFTTDVSLDVTSFEYPYH